MPIYEYSCQKCQGVFEFVQKFSDKPKQKCEACGGKLKKMISASAFHLKGGGWYKTDYASKPAGDTAKPSTTDTAPVKDAPKDNEKKDKEDKKEKKEKTDTSA